MIKSVDDILALVNAGFSRDEINKMMAAPVEPEQKKEPEPAKEPEQKADPEPEKKPESKIDTSGEDNISKMLDKLNNTLVEIQNSNIARSQQPVQTETVDDILASVINPKGKKE